MGERQSGTLQIQLYSSKYDRFHTTTEDDSTIATKLGAQGLSISARQVKELRLQHGWRRRAGTDEQVKEQRADTFQMVQQELEEGTIRAYGRELVQTHLRIYHAHRACEDDVRDALRNLILKELRRVSQAPKKEKEMANTSFVALIGSGV